MFPAGRIVLSSALLAVIGATAVSAQSVGSVVTDLTPGCQSAASKLLASPIATCANLNDLISIVTASQSIITPVNTWVTDLCKASTCSQSDLDSAKSSIETGCSTDIASGNVAAVTLDSIVTNFNTIKSAMCLQSSSNATFCVTNFLTAAQNAQGAPLTTTFLENLAGSDAALMGALKAIPGGAACTDCNKAIYNTIKPILNSTEVSALEQAASSQCGSSFTDGQTPSGVKAAAASPASGDSSGAAARVILSAGTALLAVAGVFLVAA